MANNIFNNLRLKFFLATHGFNYSIDFSERIYQIYLNHSKIIHFRNGYPVYSLSTPALFSKASANFFARLMFRIIQNKNTPSLMSFAVNDVCNCECEHCSFFTRINNKSKNTLTLKQSQKLIYDAQDLGVSVINFVGGEPLLREDLPEIISSINKDLSTSIVFTNGSNLFEKAKELKKAGLDGVYVSIDSADPKKHELIRKNKGLFNKAIKGIKEAKKLGLSTGISCCITPESFETGEFERIVELGKKIGIHEVLVFDSLPVGRYKHRKDLMVNSEWIEDLIRRSQKYNQDSNYPGILIYAYATSHRSVGCAGGTSYFYVSPYGDISPCDFNGLGFGNITKTPLYEIWDKMSISECFNHSTWGGCKARNPKYKDCVM